MGILSGKNILVTGVLTDGSIAFHVAKIAQEQGATVVLTGFGRALSLTTRIAGRLPQMPPIIELDVTDQSHLDNLAEEVRKYVPHLDGVVHSRAILEARMYALILLLLAQFVRVPLNPSPALMNLKKYGMNARRCSGM